MFGSMPSYKLLVYAVGLDFESVSYPAEVTARHGVHFTDRISYCLLDWSSVAASDATQIQRSQDLLIVQRNNPLWDFAVLACLDLLTQYSTRPHSHQHQSSRTFLDTLQIPTAALGPHPAV